jgi:hypothetical protein
MPLFRNGAEHSEINQAILQFGLMRDSMWSDRSFRSWDVSNFPWLQISLTDNWPFLPGAKCIGRWTWLKFKGLTVWDPDSKRLIQRVLTFTRSDTRVSLSSKLTISRLLVPFPRALIENHRGSTKTKDWSCPLSWGQPCPLAGIGPISPANTVCTTISWKVMVKRFACAGSLQEVSISSESWVVSLQLHIHMII